MRAESLRVLFMCMVQGLRHANIEDSKQSSYENREMLMHCYFGTQLILVKIRHAFQHIFASIGI